VLTRPSSGSRQRAPEALPRRRQLPRQPGHRGTTGYVAGIAYQGGAVVLASAWSSSGLRQVCCCWSPDRCGRPRLAQLSPVCPAAWPEQSSCLPPCSPRSRSPCPRHWLRYCSRSWRCGPCWPVPGAAVTALRPRRAPGPGQRGGPAHAGATATIWSFPNSLAWTTRPFRPRTAVTTPTSTGAGLYALSAWSERHHPWIAYFGPRGIIRRHSRAGAARTPGRISGWSRCR